MARKIRKEKHISQRVLPNGNISLLIQIKRNGKTYRKSINISDYPTPAIAMDVACGIRDDLLRNIRNNITIEKFPTIEKLYKRMHELFPCSFKTKTKYNHYYTSAISKYADIPINKITAADIQESINNYLTTHSQEDTNNIHACYYINRNTRNYRIWCLSFLLYDNCLDTAMFYLESLSLL